MELIIFSNCQVWLTEISISVKLITIPCVKICWLCVTAVACWLLWTKDMLHVVEKVDGVEMRGIVAKAEGRGTVVLRQPIPDRPELEQRFTKILVCLHVSLSWTFSMFLLYL